MNRSRVTGDLASHGNIFVDIANDRVGIGSTIPGEKLSLPDSAKIALGNSADLKIYHNGSDTYFETASTAGQIIHTANEWRLQNLAKNENMILANQDGLVRLFYNGSTKFETTSTGVTVTGTVAATSYTGDGSNLTGVSAGATGGGSDEVFYENGQTVTTSYSITSNKNAMSAGPLSINSGAVVTIPSGSVWTIV